MGRRNPLTSYAVDADGCWIWQGSLTRDGYGTFSSTAWGFAGTAHRFFYEQAGGTVPPGQHLHHVCEQRACVDPDHLEVVTPAENVRRSRTARLTASQAAEIRASNEPQRTLAARYGVSGPHICNIRNGKYWKPATR